MFIKGDNSIKNNKCLIINYLVIIYISINALGGILRVFKTF